MKGSFPLSHHSSEEMTGPCVHNSHAELLTGKSNTVLSVSFQNKASVLSMNKLCSKHVMMNLFSILNRMSQLSRPLSLTILKDSLIFIKQFIKHHKGKILVHK